MVEKYCYMRFFPSSPLLCLVTDRRLAKPRPLEEVVASAVRGGAALVQIREKDLPAGPLLEVCARISGRLNLSPKNGRPPVPGPLLLANDRVDVALAARLHGVHLGEQSLPTGEAKRLAALSDGILPVGGRFWVGRSVHSAEDAARAENDGADYLIFGHVFTTDSKPGLPPRGLRALEDTVRAVRIPVIAIGGITPQNCRRVIEAGAYGIAVRSGIMAARDPEKAAANYCSAVSQTARSEG